MGHSIEGIDKWWHKAEKENLKQMQPYIKMTEKVVEESEKDLIEAAKEYAEMCNNSYAADYYGFIAGANWARKN